MALSLYVERPTALHRRHPIAKLVAMLLLFVATFVLDDPALIAPLAALVLVGTGIGGAFGNLWRLRWLVGPVFVFTLGLWTAFYPAQAGGAVSHAEAFRFGLGMAVKLETFLMTGLLFLATTTVEEFAFAAARLGLPYRASFVLTLAFRLVPVFLEAALTVRDAQRCRGLDFTHGGLRTRLARYVPVIVPVVVGGLRRADQMAFALEVRGFSSGRRRTTLPRPAAGVADVLLVAVAIALAVLYVGLWMQGIGSFGPR
jgi:energy-coupling factor transport system permease protein